MICEVRIRFNGLEEKRTFEVGDKFDFPQERAEYLASLGFVKGAGKPAPKPRKKAKKDE